ncbi:MAG: hypothetical protein LBR93_11710 [Treponema sp.]|jgi:hypothetical protein|nr:hypothetical protein [Treponema sp.]
MNRQGLISADGDLTKTGKLIADIKMLIADRRNGIKKGKRAKKEGKRK